MSRWRSFLGAEAAAQLSVEMASRLHLSSGFHPTANMTPRGSSRCFEHGLACSLTRERYSETAVREQWSRRSKWPREYCDGKRMLRPGIPRRSRSRIQRHAVQPRRLRRSGRSRRQLAYRWCLSALQGSQNVPALWCDLQIPLRYRTCRHMTLVVDSARFGGTAVRTFHSVDMADPVAVVAAAASAASLTHLMAVFRTAASCLSTPRMHTPTAKLPSRSRRSSWAAECRCGEFPSVSSRPVSLCAAVLEPILHRLLSQLLLLDVLGKRHMCLHGPSQAKHLIRPHTPS